MGNKDIDKIQFKVDYKKLKKALAEVYTIGKTAEIAGVQETDVVLWLDDFREKNQTGYVDIPIVEQYVQKNLQEKINKKVIVYALFTMLFVQTGEEDEPLTEINLDEEDISGINNRVEEIDESEELSRNQKIILFDKEMTEKYPILYRFLKWSLVSFLGWMITTYGWPAVAKGVSNLVRKEPNKESEIIDRLEIETEVWITDEEPYYNKITYELVENGERIKKEGYITKRSVKIMWEIED